MATYKTSLGWQIDTRKLNTDDRLFLKEEYPDPNTIECQVFVDTLVSDYKNCFHKDIIKATPIKG